MFHTCQNSFRVDGEKNTLPTSLLDNPRRNLQVGDIVIMKGDEVYRNEGRLSKVSGTTTDKDGLVRRVKVCLGDRKLGKRGERLHKMSEVERPVQN